MLYWAILMIETRETSHQSDHSFKKLLKSILPTPKLCCL